MIKKLHWLSMGVFVLMLANIINDIAGRPFYPITKMIYFSWEGNLSTWYSSFIFAVGAFIAYNCFTTAKKVNIKNAHAFLLFSSLLMLMSIDEVAQLHETFGATLGRVLLNINVEQGVGIAKNTAWAWGGGLIVIIIFAVCFLYIRKPIMQVPKASLLLLSGLGAIILGGIVLEASTNFLNNDELQWLYDIEVIVEETLEMVGAMLILYAHAIWLTGVNINAKKDATTFASDDVERSEGR